MSQELGLVGKLEDESIDKLNRGKGLGLGGKGQSGGNRTGAREPQGDCNEC